VLRNFLNGSPRIPLKVTPEQVTHPHDIIIGSTHVCIITHVVGCVNSVAPNGVRHHTETEKTFQKLISNQDGPYPEEVVKSEGVEIALALDVHQAKQVLQSLAIKNNDKCNILKKKYSVQLAWGSLRFSMARTKSR